MEQTKWMDEKMSVGVVSIPASVPQSDVYEIVSENPEAVGFSQQAVQLSDAGNLHAGAPQRSTHAG